MRDQSEMYKEVAERCSSYDCCNSDSDCCTNMYDTEKSCLTCCHFSDDEHCNLDLYDPIVRNL